MTQIKLRRDTSANFTSKNPILGVGEPAYETDTKKLKIGDGTTTYTQLEYFTAGGGGSGLEVCDIGMALYVDETKGLRRYLNGQIVDINTNTQAFLDRLKQITTLHPSLFCTEEEWQTAKTMSAFGQVGKFVFNYSGDEIVSVRLPRVVNVQGLFDLQNLGMTVREKLPNIQGGVIGGIIANYASASDTAVTFTGAFEGVSTYAGTLQSGSNHFQAITNLSLDASKASSTYQNNAPVQQEAIQYPYFIQIATGSETENNIINEIELNNPYSLFDSKYSDLELNNLSWLKSSGQWNAKAVYPSAYDELLREYNSPDRLATFNKDVFEVVGNPTITDDGVASEFSGSNYLTIPKLSTLVGSADSWELDMQFTTPSDITSSRVGWLFEGNADWCNLIRVGGDAANYTGIEVSLTSTGNSYNIASYKHVVHVTANTTYWLKLIFTGTEYLCKYSTNGTDFTTVNIATSSLKISDNSTLSNIGVSKNATNPFRGSIDLKHFLITVDGVKVFSGAKSKVKLSTEEYTDYDFVLNTSDETFRLPLKNHTADDGNSVLTLYYYVGETVQNANLIDAGRIGEQLANKQDKCIHIISTYVNGQSGYRIWSDGYCEQWGRVPAGNDSDYVITFLKPYQNTDYQIGFTSLSNNTSTYGVTWSPLRIYPIDGSTASCQRINFERGWFASGYTA